MPCIILKNISQKKNVKKKFHRKMEIYLNGKRGKFILTRIYARILCYGKMDISSKRKFYIVLLSPQRTVYYKKENDFVYLYYFTK